MIKIIREVTADVIKRGSTKAVYAKQNDRNSRFLNIRIQEEGVDIVVDATSTVMLNVERPDKQENIFYGTVNEDGTVKVPLTSWMLELEGTLLCDVSIVSEDADIAKLTTMQFNIYVEAAVVSDASFMDTEEYSVIIDLLDRTTEAEAKATAAAQNAEALRAECEEATAEAKAVKEGVEAGGYIESLKELNKGEKFSTWVGTTEEYKTIAQNKEIVPNCLYLIEDELESDTWKYFTRQDAYEHEYSIGMYKILDRMCTLHLSYNPGQFDTYSNGVETCPLPVIFDIPENDFIAVPFVVVGARPESTEDEYYTGYAEIYRDKAILRGLTWSGRVFLIGMALTVTLPIAAEQQEVIE